MTSNPPNPLAGQTEPRAASAAGSHSSNRLVVALVGNPNTGKSSLFNALSGLRQKIGNYPGVTVEKKVGSFTFAAMQFDLIDLPGTYSLAPRSPDEMVAIDVLLGHQPGTAKPDVILNIVDASNLERNLYLTTQLMELGRPVIVALNMMDIAQNKGVVLDPEQISQRLGVPVIPMQAHRGQGLQELKSVLARAETLQPPDQYPHYPEPFTREVNQWRSELQRQRPEMLAAWPVEMIKRLFIDRDGATQERYLSQVGPQAKAELEAARARLQAAQCPIPQIEARVRYGWIKERLQGCVKRSTEKTVTWTSRIDAFLMHKVWGTLTFLVIFFLMFVGLFLGAKPLMDGIDAGKGWLAARLNEWMEPGVLRSLLVSGVLEGVGGVLIFLPQIMILFAFIAMLEDCGYMARAAFLMDKIMSKCGLGGKSFIPLLSSFACAIPGIMSTRVIENRRDRIATILIAPLMSCSARLPVYVLLSAAFFAPFGWWVPPVVIFGMYLVGLIAAPLVALLLKRTLLRGETPLFILEMPSYKWPSPSLVLYRMVERGWAFVRRAATLILASMILVWALLYFPSTDENGHSYDVQVAALEEQIEALPAKEKATAEELKRLEDLEEQRNAMLQCWRTQSYLGRTGRFLEPAFQPLGWDWRIGMAALASFPAREIVVGTLGIIYDEGEVDVEDEQARLALAQKLKNSTWDAGSPRAGQPVFTLSVALSLMIFFALCCQCASTLVVIKRETHSWRWPLFTFTYMTALAYLAALATYQIGQWI